MINKDIMLLLSYEKKWNKKEFNKLWKDDKDFYQEIERILPHEKNYLFQYIFEELDSLIQEKNKDSTFYSKWVDTVQLLIMLMKSRINR